MDKGTELYQHLIDELVKMSQSCTNANIVKRGFVPGIERDEINMVLTKLTENDKNILAQYVLEAYSCAIFDVLDLLEWYASCKDMKITIEGELLPTGKFEGIQNDFIGRCNGWEWK